MILRWLIHWLAIACTLLVIAAFIPGITMVSLGVALLVSLLWGFITLFIRPILALLTLPISFLTLGLFSFVLNAFLFWFLAAIVQGFGVAGFVPALEGSLILSIVNGLLHLVL